MVQKTKSPNLVGQFIRSRREHLGLSQRELGLLFEPAVTTQFISNMERGVTPLPPSHIATMVKALQVSEVELLTVLEQEYASKISARAGRTEHAPGTGSAQPGTLSVLPQHREFMARMYEAFRNSDPKTQATVMGVLESLLNLPKGAQPK